MTRSDESGRIDRILSELGELLDEQAISRRIDEPLWAAAQGYQSEGLTVLSHKSFHAILGSFVGRLHEEALPLRQHLDAQRAVAEAIGLLEESYKSAYASGYHAALVDAARDPPDGLELVLSNLTQAIIASERRKYLAFVFARILGPTDWATRCELARRLLEQHAELLPPEMRRCQPFQLADELPDLITSLLATQNAMDQLCSARFPLRS